MRDGVAFFKEYYNSPYAISDPFNHIYKLKNEFFLFANWGSKMTEKVFEFLDSI